MSFVQPAAFLCTGNITQLKHLHCHTQRAASNSDAGKTTILYRLQIGEVISTIPTIGFNVETVSYKNIKFQVWDLGGQTSIRPYWRCYYPNTQVLLPMLLCSVIILGMLRGYSSALCWVRGRRWSLCVTGACGWQRCTARAMPPAPLVSAALNKNFREQHCHFKMQPSPVRG